MNSHNDRGITYYLAADFGYLVNRYWPGVRFRLPGVQLDESSQQLARRLLTLKNQCTALPK